MSLELLTQYLENKRSPNIFSMIEKYSTDILYYDFTEVDLIQLNLDRKWIDGNKNKCFIKILIFYYSDLFLIREIIRRFKIILKNSEEKYGLYSQKFYELILPIQDYPIDEEKFISYIAFKPNILLLAMKHKRFSMGFKNGNTLFDELMDYLHHRMMYNECDLTFDTDIIMKTLRYSSKLILGNDNILKFNDKIYENRENILDLCERNTDALCDIIFKMYNISLFHELLKYGYYNIKDVISSDIIFVRNLLLYEKYCGITLFDLLKIENYKNSDKNVIKMLKEMRDNAGECWNKWRLFVYRKRNERIREELIYLPRIGCEYNGIENDFNMLKELRKE